MTPPDSDAREPNLPCPHGRSSWHHCPHCLGLNATVPLTPIPPPEHFAIVAISLDLAQRMLAALEDSIQSHEPCIPDACWCVDARIIAAELRAVIGK